MMAPRRLTDFYAGYSNPVGHSDPTYKPESINYNWVSDDPQVNLLLEQASRWLGKLDGYARLVGDVQLFIEMHIAKEANTSNQIEGTKTSFNDAISKQDAVAPEKREDWQEVQNYIRALHYAIEKLDQLPICSRLIRDTHQTLLNTGRGASMAPGTFRAIQNWIGGSNIQTAIFVPPTANLVPDLMADLESFLNNTQIQTPVLIRVALMHYQFETIHPFLDGNGRLGRLLIVLYLVATQMLHKPILYLSQYFALSRREYYDSLMMVREKSDVRQWIIYFLKGVIETSKGGVKTLDEVLKIKESVSLRIRALGRRAEMAQRLFTYLYKQPIIDLSDAVTALNNSKSVVNKLLIDLVDMGLLQETTGYNRNRRYRFGEYIAVYEREEL